MRGDRVAAGGRAVSPLRTFRRGRPVGLASSRPCQVRTIGTESSRSRMCASDGSAGPMMCMAALARYESRVDWARCPAVRTGEASRPASGSCTRRRSARGRLAAPWRAALPFVALSYDFRAGLAVDLPRLAVDRPGGRVDAHFHRPSVRRQGFPSRFAREPFFLPGDSSVTAPGPFRSPAPPPYSGGGRCWPACLEIVP